MNEINPLANVILGSIQQQRILGIEKSRQLRRAKVLANKVTDEDDQLEHEVETTDALTAIHDEQQNQQQPERDPPKKPEDDKPHIDIRG